MFGKKDARTIEDFKREVITHPEVIDITIECLRAGLATYAEGLRDDIEAISSECGLKWSSQDINENVNMLYDICLFLAPGFYTQTINDETVSRKYWLAFLDSMKDRKNVFDYFLGIQEKYRTNPLGLFSFLLALKYRTSFEKLMRSVKVRVVSARAVSFTNDFTSDMSAVMQY
jgi:hypothetical protein